MTVKDPATKFSPASDERFQSCLEQLQTMRHFVGEAQQFWSHYLALLADLCDASKAVIVTSATANQGEWGTLAYFPVVSDKDIQITQVLFPFSDFDTLQFDQPAIFVESTAGPLIALQLNVGLGRSSSQQAPQQVIAALLVPSMSEKLFKKMRLYLELLNDIPASFQISRVAGESSKRVELLANTMDFMVLIDEQERFLPAAMMFCNELAARHHCDNVSLGWLEKGYIRVKAISHRDNFKGKSEAVQRLEAAMEEAFDQDAEIVWPVRPDNRFVLREHKFFAENYDARYICSLPLRLNGEAVAVCTCERHSKSFATEDLSVLRLACDQSVRRLADLKKWDRWFGAIIVSRIKEKAASWLGFQHTWTKLLAITIAFVLAILCFVKVTHRVEATAILRSEDVRYLTAPFDGHIERVAVRLGDEVEANDRLLQLDTHDLRLEEASLLAEQARYQREFEKARAANALADMRIAQSRQKQITAQLNLARYRLQQAVINAPFSGIVVEGDLRERVGAPIRQGDMLFKLAKSGNLYVELEVDEADIHFFDRMYDGELALASRPDQEFDIEMMRVEPVAVVKEAGNVFIVRCAVKESADWWRPGMTGVAKLNTEKRTLLWIFTHRTIEFLRLYFWW